MLQRILQGLHAIAQRCHRGRRRHLRGTRVTDQQVQAGAGHAQCEYAQRETTATLAAQWPQHQRGRQRCHQTGHER